MPFDRPTLATLIRRAQSDFATRLPGADARLRRSVEYVLARVAAGAAHGLYGYASWIARQIIPDSAEAEYLERWAGIWGVERKAAVAASGPVRFTGNDGTPIPAGTSIRRSDGATYTSNAAAVIAAGAAIFDVTANDPGTVGNLAEGGLLSLTSPIAGVVSPGTVVAGGIANGTATETDPALLSRLLARIQTPPKGGGPGDYVAWALEIAGVTRAWEYPRQLGLGTVVLMFVLDEQAGSIIPGAPKIAEVQAYIDARAPVTADITVNAPAALAVPFQIQLTPNTAAVRAAVEASLRATFQRDAEPGATLLISRLREAISIAAGETDHVLLAPVANIVPAAHEIPVPGIFTWS